MCGIVGKFNFNKAKVDKDLINNMLKSIIHRGPDHGDVYIDKNLGLGHRLLKIQDLSNKSYQPIKYNNYIMSYNGEIYNFIELREKLYDEGVYCESDGDTEVLIKCFSCYGIDKTLEIINGCYAIALFDLNKRDLYLIRDRIGIKPLYYYQSNESIVFASEIKAILQDKGIKREYDIDTVLLSLNCKLWMPHEKTLFSGIYMLEQGTYLIVNENGVEKKRYYNYEYNSKCVDSDDIINEFGEFFCNSVRKKLVSKVPFAAFLSGGIDSSLMCKMAKDQITQDNSINTYTVWYSKDKNLDLNCALELASNERFTQHNTLISPEHYNIENIDKVIYHVEEVLTDKVYISVYYNYKAAKDDGFTVVLNGQGADELWLGYYNSWGIYHFKENKNIIKSLIKEYYLPNAIFAEKLKLSVISKSERALVDYLNKNFVGYRKDDLLNDFQILSMRTILHDLLTQEDKLAMAHSVESRVPYVDEQELVSLSLKTQSKIKIKDGREKYILRKYSKNILPESITAREKLSFQEPPDSYNKVIDNLIKTNWEQICNCKIVKYLIKNEYLKSYENFSNQEKWWLLVYWRFETIFKMEVKI